MPKCEICQKLVSVPTPIKAGGPILHVCRDCEKYGEGLKETDIDRIIQHCDRLDVIFIGEEGE